MPQKNTFPVLATAVTAYRDIFGNPANYFRMLAFSLALMFFVIDLPTHFISQEVKAGLQAHQAAQEAQPSLPPETPPEVAEKAAEALAGMPTDTSYIKTEYILAG